MLPASVKVLVCTAPQDMRASFDTLAAVVRDNSCRDRHCPKCQSLRQARWISQRQARILPTHYFHVVFTVPEQLHAVTRQNRARFFALLFESAANTLLELGEDPKRLGGQLGITAVLHFRGPWLALCRDYHYT